MLKTPPGTDDDMRIQRGARGRHRGKGCLLPTVLTAARLAACGPAPRADPPSVLLFVFDTTRVDAVSAYGRVAGTTPTADALAAAGLRYTRAHAQAPWTLPSHVTLFTGLLPSQHGVGWRRTRAPDDLVTLAERLRDAGYETVGVAENGWLHEAFNMTQGFERFTGVDLQMDEHGERLPDVLPDVRAAVATWVRERDPRRPFFLFVNVIDPHYPYLVRSTNPFLPPGVDSTAAAVVPQDPGQYLCSRTRRERELEILRGLYLGGVAEADAKLRDVLGLLRDAGLSRDLVTVVTADHGELFGEHHLVSHQFSVSEALLHVPLIVHGLRGVTPAVIGDPVQLADIMPTVLRWAGAVVPDGLAGRELPTVPPPSAVVRAQIAEYVSPDGEAGPDELPFVTSARKKADYYRRSCTRDDRVFGDMRTIIRYPHKLIWYANYPMELYDLDTYPLEERDLATTKPALVAILAEELLRSVSQPSGIAGDASRPAAEVLPPPAVVDGLRALGYLGGADRFTPAPQ